MANVGVSVTFQTRSGRALTLNDQVAEGTETEVQSGGAGLNVVDNVSLACINTITCGQLLMLLELMLFAMNIICWYLDQNVVHFP